jgi:hypothetical protein
MPALQLGVGVGEPDGSVLTLTVIRSRFGAHAVGLAKVNVFVPFASATLTLTVPMVLDPPVDANRTRVAVPPLTCSRALRLAVLVYATRTVAVPATAAWMPLNRKVPPRPTRLTCLPPEHAEQPLTRAPPASVLAVGTRKHDPTQYRRSGGGSDCGQ